MMARLGDICNILNGYAFKSEDYISSGIRIIRIANVQKGYIEDSTPAFYPIDTPNIGKYMLLENDLLVSLTGNVGRVALLKKEFLPAALNQRVACIRIKDGAPYDKSFVYCCLNSDFFENKCIQSAKGVAQKNMSTEWLKEYEIPDLSLEKQREIATVLNKLSDLINFRQQQIIKLDELVKARFVEMFGDLNFNENGLDIVSIEELCTLIKDGTHQTPTYTEDKQSGFKFLSSKDVMTQKISWDDIKYIPTELHEKLYATIQPKRNDILMSKNGVNYGVAAVNDTDEVFDIYVSLALLRPIVEKVNPVYLQCAINSPDTKRQFDSSIKGIGVPNLHLGEIKKTKILLPPMSKQNEFVSFVEQIDKSKFEVQQSLEKLETLKKSLMQQYFR